MTSYTTHKISYYLSFLKHSYSNQLQPRPKPLNQLTFDTYNDF